VVLGGDGGERVRAVTVALEIRLGDAGEDAGEAGLDATLGLEVGGGEQDLAHARAGVAVIFSTPITSVTRPRLAARKSSAPWMAAEPVAQAFSSRVAGLKRSSGTAWNTSEDGKSCCWKPPLKVPRKMASTSCGSRPASAIASRATRPMSASASGASSSLPKRLWAQPMMAAS
jgi:hypothetical protein